MLHDFLYSDIIIKGYYSLRGGVHLTVFELEGFIKLLIHRYNAEYAILFGSYARGDFTPDSDVDVVVVGGPHFRKMNIFAFAEDLRELTGKAVDAFELSEINAGSSFYQAVMNEGRHIA